MNIVLAAHGMFASGVISAANLVFGQIDRLDVVTFEPGENVETLKNKYNEIIGKYDQEEEILFLVDLFGGSPYNAAFEVTVNEPRMDIITGLSLPMLIDVVTLREMEKEMKAAEVYEKLECSTYIRSSKKIMSEMKAASEEEDEL